MGYPQTHFIKETKMDNLARTLQKAFPKLTRPEIKLRIIKAAKDPVFGKIQLLQKFGSSQEEIDEQVMRLLIIYMRLPRNAPQLLD